VHSFTGDTKVLLADGSTKRIDQIKVGDSIGNAAPGKSGTETHQVDRVIVTQTDHDFVDVTVSTGKIRKLVASLAVAAAVVVGGHSSTLTTTYHHPFYDKTQAAFVDAADLHVGDELQTPDGVVTVTGVRLYHATQTTYDLTVGGLHTYYVVAGSTPLLVHNCVSTYGSDRLSQAVQKARLNAKNKGNNYAAALLRDPETGEELGIVVARSQGRKHAEQTIIEQLRAGALPGVDESYISEMYSEFQPCKSRCSVLMGNLPNLVKSAWSWAWDYSGSPTAIASTAARNSAIAELFKQGVPGVIF
jgi:Xanthomonas XOO_2897-like deaminase/Pretoxin HINT domain